MARIGQAVKDVDPSLMKPTWDLLIRAQKTVDRLSLYRPCMICRAPRGSKCVDEDGTELSQSHSLRLHVAS